MTCNNRSDQFVFGSQMYRVPSVAIADVKKDIHTMKNLGFNTVKIQMSWSITEQKEGIINIEEVEEIVCCAENIGMGVFLGLTMEQAPMWLWKKYPDSRMINAAGQVHDDPTQYLLPADGKPGPCHDHPGVQAEMKRYISTITEKLAKNENIIVWNIWQEIGFRERPGATTLSEKTYCYCHHTLNRFRSWLKEKYKDLKALNDVWRTGFGKWAEVEPPRMFMMVPSWIDWRYFINMANIPDALKRRYNWIKENDPLRRPVMAHEDAPVLGSGRSWAYSEVLDISGTSFYPDWTAAITPWDYGFPGDNSQLKYEMFRSSLHFDYMRSAAIGRKRKEFWAAEFQSGPTINDGMYIGSEPEPEHINRWLMLALSCGVQGICFWNHRPEIFWSEMHGFGLCDWDGKPTKYAQEAGQIGRAINQHHELFKLGHTPHAQVAIAISENLYNFAEATTDMLKHLQHTIKGWYESLWEEGIRVDFVEENNILKGSLEPYKVAILPFPIALGNELAEAIIDYVAGGGVLITEACPGRVNQYGIANHSGMAAPLKRLFGVKDEKLRLTGEWGETKWLPKDRHFRGILPPAILNGTGNYQGHSVQANLYVETYVMETDKETTLDSEEILLYKKNVSGIRSNYGKGRAYLIGTLAGHAISTGNHEATRKFMLKLVTDAGVEPERHGNLLLRRRILGKKEAWFFINNSNKSVTESIHNKKLINAKDLMGNKPLPVDNGTFKVTVKPFNIRCLIVENQ